MPDDKPEKKYSSEAHRRFAEFEPKLISTNPAASRRDEISGMLPKGGTFSPRQANLFLGGSIPEGSSLFGGAGSAQYHLQRPFMPEWDSPDRQQYPHERKRANFYWRMYHKYDPLFGTAMDMYSEMLVSKFDIVVPDDESREIRDTLETMVERVDFLDRLRYITREYLVIGEVFPHLFWSDDEGMWTYIGFHNPDNIEVKDAPIINMDPVVSFLPDDSLRLLLTDGTPEAMEFRKKLPAEFVSKVMARQPIRLSPLNCSFIARKMHPYDIRGTSLASRLWRIWMVEDSVYRATIATYRRQAAPLKVAKLGDAASGWMPSPENEARLLDLLARAEADSEAWIIWNYGINFEAFGTAERAITIDKQHDVIERIKLSGLGLSKGFMGGEISFASVKGGLQVFLRRLLSMRQFEEAVWIYPKFFKPVAQMNEWYKAKPSETAHKYRVKRTAQEMEEEGRLILPELMWHNKLDSKVDQDLLNAYKIAEALGAKVSKAKIYAAMGLDSKEELEENLKEFKETEEAKEKVLGDTYKKKYEEETKPAKPPGGAGSGAKPPGGDKKPTDKTPPGGAEKAVPLDDGLEAPGEGAMPATIE
jgi:hypothetical protein